jgi:hypothetical protein
VELDLAEGIDKSEEKLGSFAPFFIYYPDEGALPPYPTLPTDMVNLIRIGRGMFALLEGEIA